MEAFKPAIAKLKEGADTDAKGKDDPDQYKIAVALYKVRCGAYEVAAECVFVCGGG